MEVVRGLFFDAGGTVFDWKNTARVQWDGILSCEFLGYYKPSLQAYKKGVSLLGLQPAEARR